jgi:hypothetical protein
MTTPLDITDFVYNSGTLTIAPGDTTAVFAGTSLSANIKNGDTLCAGGVKVPVKTVTDDTHAELFTAWDGASVTGGTYVILKDSMLRDNAVQIGYDTAAFLSLLDNTTIWYVVEGAAPDPSVGEDSNRALKTNVTPWQQWLKTGGLWVLQPGSPGGPGATILVQDAEPDTSHPDNSLWIDSDSADLDVYALTGSPPAWTDTGMNLKGATGPASWAAPAAWVTGTAYVAAPPASAVTQGGETYVCLTAHTSGAFSTDLAAGKWIKVAAKGADGTGVGDMVKATYDPTNVAGDVFNQDNMVDGTTNKNFTATEKTKLSGLNAANYATAAQGTKADSAVQSVVGGTGITVDVTDPHNPIVSAGASGTFGQGILAKSGSNIVLSPKNGNLLTINGTAYAVPDSGVSLAATGLTASTLYYIYVYMNSGTMTLEASTTAHATSTATGNKGVEIKSGDDTRTLVGMVRPITGPAFADTVAQRFVRSWFNRKSVKTGAGFSTTRTFTSASFAEINSEIKNETLLWGDETWTLNYIGTSARSSGTFFVIGIGVDSTSTQNISAVSETGVNIPVAMGLSQDGLAEGYHYATILGKTDGSSTVAVTVNAISALTGVVR